MAVTIAKQQQKKIQDVTADTTIDTYTKLDMFNSMKPLLEAAVASALNRKPLQKILKEKRQLKKENRKQNVTTNGGW